MKKKVGFSSIVIALITLLVSCNFLDLDINRNKGKDVGILLNSDSNNILINAGINECTKKLGTKFDRVEVKNGSEKSEVFKEAKNLSRNNSLSIFVDSSMQDISNKVAMLYKEKDIVVFEQKVEKKNVLEIEYKYNDISYIMGMIAANESKNGNIGIIAFENTYKVEEYISGFVAGANATNRILGKKLIENNIKIIEKEESIEESIEYLANNKCDIIFEVTNTNQDKIYNLISQKNIKIISANMITKEFYDKYKESILLTIVKREDLIIEEIVSSYQKGTFKSGPESKIEFGLKNGFLDLSKESYMNINDKMKKKVDYTKNKIIEGDIIVPKSAIESLEFTE